MPAALNGTKKVIGGNDVFFVAEIGKNFIQTDDERSVAEYLENAKALVDAAVEAQADAVKFQTHEVEDEVLNIEFSSPHFTVKGSERHAWVTRNTNATPLEEFWKPLKKHCERRGISFFSTPMSRKAAVKLDLLGVPFWKVGSGDIQDCVLLDFLIETKKPIMLASGMVSLKELDEVIRYARGRGADISVLYCVSRYPAPKESFNLGTIEYLREKYPDIAIGFSDHSLGHDVALSAAKLGARIIEKHFSFSRDLWGSDHKVSMTPREFKDMVVAVRSGAHRAVDHTPYYGFKEKELEGADNLFRPHFNKALMAGTDIPAGTTVTKDMLFAMRPIMHAGGLPARQFHAVVGKKITQALRKYEPLTLDMVEHATPAKRKVCFVLTSFIHYSRNFLILEELKDRGDVDLHIALAGTVLLDKYSARRAHVKDMLERDGFENIHEVYFNLEGSKPVVKAKTAGLGIIEFSALFDTILPDLVVVRGDRFEVLAAATAAALMNISLAHIEGGDATGTIDESIRHAVTKLSHIHFATNESARKRIVQMGENPEHVFNFGSPDIEVAQKLSREPLSPEIINTTGSGATIDPKNDYIVVAYHPVTSELDRLAEHTKVLIDTVHELGTQALWFWPNFDAGAEENISHQLRFFNDTTKDHKIRFLRYLPPQEYLSLLNGARCLVGNSSAGIKECSYLGVPVVNVGTRQKNRLTGPNVLNVSVEKEAIQNGIRKQLAVGRYPSSDLYAAKDTSKNIAKTLAIINLYIQKTFYGK